MPQALDHLLAQASPYGAVVLDRTWDLLQLNRPMEHMLALVGLELAPGDNLLRALFTADGMRRFVANWEEVARDTLVRVHREAIATGDEQLFALFEELLAAPGVPEDWRRDDPDGATALILPMRLDVLGRSLSLFTTVTTLGTPVDVTLSELRIEQHFPADEATRRFVHEVLAPML